MTWKETIEHYAEEAGISKPLTKGLVSLTALLEQHLDKKGENDLRKLASDLPQLAAQSFENNGPPKSDPIYQVIQKLSLDEIIDLLRLSTIFFHLINSLEQHEIIRVNRERAQTIDIESPRPESIADALLGFKKNGISYERAVELFKKLDIQPTITAHPTEARRRSILLKQENITSMISDIEDERLTPNEKQELLHKVLNEITLLILTDEVRAERLTVEDEVENGLYFFTNSIWDTVPRLYDDIRFAFQQQYAKSPDIPIILRYRSWVGSDRDGNPNVTRDVTWNTFLEQRRVALKMFARELREIRRFLSISQNLSTVSDELIKSLKKDEREVPLGTEYKRRYKNEPYRKKLTHMMKRLQNLLDASSASDEEEIVRTAQQYTSADFHHDLDLIKKSLVSSGMDEVANFGKFNDLRIRAYTFGFHIAALDVRQHSGVHEKAVSNLLEVANVTGNYSDLSEDEKVKILTAELRNPRPLCPVGHQLEPDTEEILDVFELIHKIVRLDKNALGSYIVSMTHGVSDLLEVAILAKETGLWKLEKNKVKSYLDIVPLYETIEDLDNSPQITEQILTNPLYKKHVKARNNFQELMLGYSDSNKDGGYWMANWALQKAQLRLGKSLKKQNVDFRLFHGRGGSVGRGGGRSNRAILALPSISNNGKIRFTEQGEIISFRYSLPEITRRHLEQVVNAVARVTAGEGQKAVEEGDETEQIMNRIADKSMKAYRELIDAPEFWDWFKRVSPVEHIGDLPIASRPVSRASSQDLQFSNLRAIPWVFGWTQTRYNVPGWYGLGAALEPLIDKNPEMLKTLQNWYKEWSFFGTIVDNAQREMARTHRLTSTYYAQRGKTDKPHNTIMDDFERSRNLILQITGQSELLDSRKVIQNSIKFRNLFTYPLNVIQVELLSRREKASEDEEISKLRHALFLSINGVAAAMQSTG